MSGKYFLDTNIFVYSFDADAPAKAERATELITDAVTTRKGMVSYQVVQEFFNVALRRFRNPLNADEAQQYLSAVLRPLLVVHSSEALVREALQISARYQIPWYDALIIGGAIQAQCEILYSEDFQHGQRFDTVKIQNPFL